MMARRKRMHGRILAVWEEKLGTELIADAAVGATVLYVDDISPFNDDEDEPGGWLMVGDQVVEYTTVDDDASTIKLANPLTTTVTADGDEPEVWVWNDLYDEVDSVQWAQVRPDGNRDHADAIEAIVSDSIDGLPNGDRGRPREGCLIERDGDEWELVKVKGRPSKARGVRFWDLDTFTAADAGARTFTLTHIPIEGSLHVILWGWYTLQHDEFSVDGKTVTIPDPDGVLEAGDVIDFKYAYLVGVATPTLTTSVIPYESTGWKYLAVSSSDNTNRSAVELDDSAWAAGQAGFGEPAGSQSLGQVNTYVPHSQGVWLRRHLPGGGAHSIKLRIDGSVRAYWNGTLVGSWAQFGETAAVPIPQELVRGDQNVIAIFHFDYDQPNAVNMIDVQITSEVSA